MRPRGEPVVFGEAHDLPTYERIGRSIAADQRSAEVNPFSSNFDCYLAGKTELLEQEALGLEFFNGKGKCALCHLSDEPAPLFTDFTYDNLGVPKNPANPFYAMPKKWNPDGYGWIDPGLGGFLRNAGFTEDEYMAEWGKHKVPTLRNVGSRPPLRRLRQGVRPQRLLQVRWRKSLLLQHARRGGVA